MAFRHKIRIVHVITRLVLGGAQENTLLTVAHLDRQRFEITLASGPTEGPEGSVEDRIPADITFVRVPDLVREPNPWQDAVALSNLYRLMRVGRYDIVHTHTTKAGILGRIAASLADVPVRVHTPHGHAFVGYLGPMGSHLLVFLERLLAKITDRIICLTAAERDDHLQLRVGQPEQFAVIHSGIDLDRIASTRVNPANKRRELGLPADGPLIGCVARLAPVKGVAILLRAASSVLQDVPGTTFVLVGDGPQRKELQNIADRLRIRPHVRFLGLRHDVPELLPLFDLAVLPSLNEGMGKGAVEAMAAGLPVVGSRTVGIQDVIEDGRTGLLVPPGDPQVLAAAIVNLLQDHARRTAMGEEGRQRAARFGIPQMIQQIEELYDALMDQSRHSTVTHRISKTSTP